MKFNLENADRYTIIGYRPGEITVLVGMQVNPETERQEAVRRHLSSSFILAPDSLIADWPVQSIEALENQHLQDILQLEPELVLLGSGATHRFPDISRLSPLLQAQIGYEVMDSQAACRTYNLLRGEGRRVVAAIVM